MAKKHKHPEHENLERWLVSYADFMTLLFATFTALYALSLSDVNKLKNVAEAISQGFEEQSILHGIKSILEGQSPPNKNPDPIASDKGAGPGIIGKFESMTYKPGEIKSEVEHIKGFVKDLQEEVETWNEHIQAVNAAAGTQAGAGTEDAATPLRPVEMAVQERGIRVSLDSRLLFDAGSATVRPDAHKFLDDVAGRLKKYQGNRIFHIEGHTDDQSIATAIFPSNWELSGARASSIVRYFIGRHQFNPGTLVAVGYGSTQPVATNRTAEGRARNRRVDIVIYTEKMSALISPRLQALKEQPVATKTSHPDDKKVIPALPPLPPSGKSSNASTTTGPVKVIIKEKDGTERVLIPKTRPADPTAKAGHEGPVKVKVADVKASHSVPKPATIQEVKAAAKSTAASGAPVPPPSGSHTDSH